MWDKAPVNKTTEEIMSPESVSRETKKDQMYNVVIDLLSDGPKTVDEIREALESKGLSFRSIERHKGEFNIISYRPDNRGPWYWKIARE